MKAKRVRRIWTFNLFNIWRHKRWKIKTTMTWDSKLRAMLRSTMKFFFGENSHFCVAYFLLWTMRIQNIYGMWGLLLHYRRKIDSSRLQKKILAYSSEYAIISIYYDSYQMSHTIWVTKTIALRLRNDLTMTLSLRHRYVTPKMTHREEIRIPLDKCIILMIYTIWVTKTIM